MSQYMNNQMQDEKIPIEDGKYYQKYISHWTVKKTANLA